MCSRSHARVLGCLAAMSQLLAAPAKKAPSEQQLEESSVTTGVQATSFPSPEQMLCTHKCHHPTALTLCRLLFPSQYEYSKFFMTRNSKA